MCLGFLTLRILPGCDVIWYLNESKGRMYTGMNVALLTIYGTKSHMCRLTTGNK